MKDLETPHCIVGKHTYFVQEEFTCSEGLSTNVCLIYGLFLKLLFYQ